MALTQLHRTGRKQEQGEPASTCDDQKGQEGRTAHLVSLVNTVQQPMQNQTPLQAATGGMTTASGTTDT